MYNIIDSVKYKNPGNYVTLADYNDVFPRDVICNKQHSHKENYSCSSSKKKKDKEEYGAFSIRAAVRYPWYCCNSGNCPVVPGVN